MPTDLLKQRLTSRDKCTDCVALDADRLICVIAIKNDIIGGSALGNTC